MCCHHFNILK